jgi:alpha-galactosidase
MNAASALARNAMAAATSAAEPNLPAGVAATVSWRSASPTRSHVSYSSRHQHVLDLTHPGAYAHILSALDALLKAYPITYLKWDHNRLLEHTQRVWGSDTNDPIERKQIHRGLELIVPPEDLAAWVRFYKQHLGSVPPPSAK